MSFEMIPFDGLVIAEMKILRCETVNKLILWFKFHFCFYRFIKDEIIRGGEQTNNPEV
jgi:hypothetical protein